MSNFWDKYVLIVTTTRDILMDPFAFGDTIGDTPADSKRAAVYLGEGAIFFYSLFQLADYGSTSELPYSGVPVTGEILAALLILGAVVMAIVTHPIALWFSGSKTSIHASLTSFLYWSGCCLFVIPPIMVMLIMGSEFVFSAIPYGEDIRFFAFMIIGVPFMFIYYVGTISTWIGKSYDTEPILGGIAVVIAYVASSGIGGVLAWLAGIVSGSGG